MLLLTTMKGVISMSKSRWLLRDREMHKIESDPILKKKSGLFFSIVRICIKVSLHNTM